MLKMNKTDLGIAMALMMVLAVLILPVPIPFRRQSAQATGSSAPAQPGCAPVPRDKMRRPLDSPVQSC